MARLTFLALLAFYIMSATAQFGFFDQMFNGGSQQQQRPQDVRSDSSWYKAQYENAQCSHYLCPGTLSCVHFPHHCPCAWDAVEDKVELGEGIAICGTKGGWSEGEFGRKVDEARRGVL